MCIRVIDTDLGLSGQGSEAELHLRRLRLDAGRMNRVRSGQYRQLLPTGLVRLPDGKVVKDPDDQVRHAIELVFVKIQPTLALSPADAVRQIPLVGSPDLPPQRMKRARYEARLAERQYDAVGPDNRLAAAELERRWEEKLRQLQTTQEAYERFSHHYSVVYTRRPIHRQCDIAGYDEMVERIGELLRQGRNDKQIAAQLMAEGFHTARSASVSPVAVQKIRLARGWYLFPRQRGNVLEFQGHLTALGL